MSEVFEISTESKQLIRHLEATRGTLDFVINEIKQDTWKNDLIQVDNFGYQFEKIANDLLLLGKTARRYFRCGLTTSSKKRKLDEKQVSDDESELEPESQPEPKPRPRPKKRLKKQKSENSESNKSVRSLMGLPSEGKLSGLFGEED